MIHEGVSERFDPCPLPERLARVAPVAWRMISEAEDGIAWRAPRGIRVICSTSRDRDTGDMWVHISVSHSGSTQPPRWETLVAVRDSLVPDVECYSVAPPRERYVNLNPGVLHLWGNLSRTGGVLPPFEGRLPDGRLTI